jgi:hypothetical protein
MGDAAEQAPDYQMMADYDLVQKARHKKLWVLQREACERNECPHYFAVIDDLEADPFVIWFRPDEFGQMEIRLNTNEYRYILFDPNSLRALSELAEEAQRRFDRWLTTKAGRKYLES